MDDYGEDVGWDEAAVSSIFTLFPVTLLVTNMSGYFKSFFIVFWF